MKRELSKISWGWIIAAIMAGLVFGMITVSGALYPFENFWLLILLILVGVILFFRVTSYPIRQAFIAGAVCALAAGLVQVSLWPIYAENNPGSAEAIQQVGLSVGLYFALATPIGMAICGAISAISGFAAQKVSQLI